MKGFCEFVTLLVLFCDAPVFVLAISASALRMADVSAAGAPLGMPAVFAGCSVKEMKSFGGLPGGVVEFTPTEKKNIRGHVSRNARFVLVSSSSCYTGESYQLLEHLASA